jgi:hypothetical protein
MSFVLIPAGKVQIDRNADDDCIYGVNFAARLEAGDTVSTGTATGVTGITVSGGTNSGSICKARISGAASGTNFGVEFKVTTAGGDTFARTIYFNTL